MPLELFIRVVDAELLISVPIKLLKTIYVEDTDKTVLRSLLATTRRSGAYCRVQFTDQPLER